jgi:hypothetical protein
VLGGWNAKRPASAVKKDVDFFKLNKLAAAKGVKGHQIRQQSSNIYKQEPKDKILNKTKPDVLMAEKGFGRANKPSENIMQMLQ